VCGIVAREVMPTWERMWDDFVQEEIRLAAKASKQQQQQSVSGVEDLSLWTKGKKKTSRGGQQGPKFGGPPQRGERSSRSGQKRDMSTVRCFACGEMGHYAGQCPKKKKKQQDVSAATTEEIDFSNQFARECAFVTTLSAITPSSIRWGDRVEEDRLIRVGDWSTHDSYSF
jgi:hypothetical protein